MLGSRRFSVSPCARVRIGIRLRRRVPLPLAHLLTAVFLSARAPGIYFAPWVVVLYCDAQDAPALAAGRPLGCLPLMHPALPIVLCLGARLAVWHSRDAPAPALESAASLESPRRLPWTAAFRMVQLRCCRFVVWASSWPERCSRKAATWTECLCPHESCVLTS